MKPKYLFVCIGNICRSAMAQYLAEHYFQRKAEVDSAGLYPHGNRAYQKTVKTLEKLYGISSQHHKPKSIHEVDLSSFKKIYVMDNGVLFVLKKKYPNINFEDWHVEDPYYGNDSLFESVAIQIQEKILHMMESEGI